MLLSTAYRFTFSTTIITVKTTSNVEFFAVDSLQKLKHTVGTSPILCPCPGGGFYVFAACLNPYATLHLTAL